MVLGKDGCFSETSTRRLEEVFTFPPTNEGCDLTCRGVLMKVAKEYLKLVRGFIGWREWAAGRTTCSAVLPGVSETNFVQSGRVSGEYPSAQ